MYEVTSTGENSCFGKKNERIQIADNHVLHAIKHGWINPVNMKYCWRWDEKKAIKEKKVAIMPEKKIYIMNELKAQTRALDRISKELEFIEQKHDLMKDLIINGDENHG